MIKKITLLGFIFASQLVLALPKIAVVDFDTSSMKYDGQIIATQLSEYIVDELVNLGQFDVIEREKMQTIMRELGFSSSGMVDMNGAAQMGRLLGAKYLLTGKVIALNKSMKRFKGYGVDTNNAIYTLSASIRIFDTEKGSIVFSNRAKSSTTINEGGGLQIHVDNVYEPLADEMSVELIGNLKDSPFINPPKADTQKKVTFVQVQFDSTPINADVEIDGIFYGNTGSKLKVPEGLHQVVISISGYSPWNKRVMLSNEGKINATLSPIE